jgi:hypothetical protein
VRSKVQALFPAHEHEQFTQYFFDEVQTWRAEDTAARAPKKRGAKAAKKSKAVVITAAAPKRNGKTKAFKSAPKKKSLAKARK